MPDNSVVIVESPAKAKTINKYLGDRYTVLASFGHVRDLPAKDGSVRPDEDFAMDWELGDRSKRHVDDIARAAKGAKHVYLATDPDREGEAIAWHIQELLKEKNLFNKTDVKRVTFNEITKGAVLEAMAHPRDVNQELVDAYLARRALDYLVGFTLSPVLWRKLPGSRSAGRVQSVALRLVCQRESEIEVFKPQEYWTIDGGFTTPAGQAFTARLHALDGKKLDKFALPNKTAADAAVARASALSYRVGSVERRQVRRNPYAPFTTSTLQQEASRKLGLGATRTMRIAQKLYEGVEIRGDSGGVETVGLITYMRTDGVQLSQEAIESARRLINSRWGGTYVPNSPRIYKNPAKNAQEAHEAIRPTDLFRTPEQLTQALDRDELRLYELVWKRTVASQMESAVFDQVTVDITSPKNEATFRATGSIVQFDGFLKVYQEDKDDPADQEEEGRRLPAMKEGDELKRGEIKPDQHFTEPPPRFTEASLVKRLEELGIGRPSTYASILQVLQDREYVRLDKKRFVPEDRGRVVTAFLEAFFPRYVEYGFTAELEEKLDEVSDGKVDWKQLLRDFWQHFSAAIGGTKDLTITQVLNELDEMLGPHFFPIGANGIDPRKCPTCGNGRLSLKLGKKGAFIGCSAYPDCKYTRPLAVAGGDDGGDRILGDDPDTGMAVAVKRGPFGAYVQLGPKPEGKDGEKEKPKRVSLPRNLSVSELTLETALRLLSLPRLLGKHPDSGDDVTAGIGRFGPYLKHGDAYKNLTADDDVLTIGMNRAVVLLAGVKPKKSVPGRELGNHPKDSKPVTLGSGRFGPYVRHNKLFASIPKAIAAETITLAQAIELLAAKAAKDSGKGAKPAKAEPAEKPAKAAPKKPAAKKSAAKKSSAKKPAARTPAKTAAPAKKAPAKPTAKAAAKPAAKPAAKKPAAKASPPAKPKRAASR